MNSLLNYVQVDNETLSIVTYNLQQYTWIVMALKGCLEPRQSMSQNYLGKYLWGEITYGELTQNDPKIAIDPKIRNILERNQKQG